MSVQDVFISYAHLDNESLLEEQDGWISIFRRVLDRRLAQLLGRPAVVWWDSKRLTGNSYFDDTIAAACDNSTVMVSIVTPRYLNSDYCRLEVEHFSKTRGGLRVGDRSRLISAIKTPVSRTALFGAMDGKLGYEFFHTPADDGRFREYDIYDPKLKPMFMAALEDLAQDISQLIIRIEADAAKALALPSQATEPSQPVTLSPSARPAASALATSSPPSLTQSTSSLPPSYVSPPRTSAMLVKSMPESPLPAQRVFLATTAGDVKAVREALLRELVLLNADIVPAQAWNENVKAFEVELAAAADSASLSIHILGSSYGTVPEDAEASYPVMQFDRARAVCAARSADAPLARILWLAPDAKPSKEKQQQFLERVRADSTLGPLDELLAGSEEELKERVLVKLEYLAHIAAARAARAQQQPSSPSMPVTSGSSRPTLGPVPKIYVISSDTEPGNEVALVERTLGQQGLDVISSLELAEEDSESAREARHQQWLEECDGCLIYHGNTKVSWVRAQVDEVRKALGHRARGEMRGHAVYVAPPLEALKRRYQVHFPKLEGSSEVGQDLQPFVAQIVGVETARLSEQPELAAG